MSNPKFTELGYLTFIKYLKHLKIPFSDLIQYKSEKHFNLIYEDKRLINKAIDQFLLLDQELINVNVAKKLISYVINNKYKEKEVFSKILKMKSSPFTVYELIDKYGLILIKDEDLAIELLKNEDFLDKIMEHNEMHDLFLKPLIRKKYKVCTYILESENEKMKKIFTQNSEKILNVLLTEMAKGTSIKIKQLIEEKNIFSIEVLKNKQDEIKFSKNFGNFIVSDKMESWLNNEMIKVTYEMLDKKLPMKNIKVKKQKI